MGPSIQVFWDQFRTHQGPYLWSLLPGLCCLKGHGTTETSWALSVGMEQTLHTHTHTHTHTHMHAHTHAGTHTRMHTHTRRHTHTHAPPHTHTHMHAHTRTHTHTHTHACTHTHTHACTHACTHTNTHTHTHMQSSFFPWSLIMLVVFESCKNRAVSVSDRCCDFLPSSLYL